jgi:hypothetical protein
MAVALHVSTSNVVARAGQCQPVFGELPEGVV